MDNKHFEFTNETVTVDKHTLYRIKATRDIPRQNVKKGDLGGFVESYDNLNDDAWVADNACVYEDAKIFGDARVCVRAKVYGNAQVYDFARVYASACIHGNAKVFGSARVSGYTQVHGYARIYDFAKVRGSARVYGNAQVYDHAIVEGGALVYENAKVLGKAEVSDSAEISGDALIKSIKDYIIFKNFWASGIHVTWTRSNNMWRVGCFYGTGEELIEEAYEWSDVDGRNYERIVHYVNSAKNDVY